MERVLDRTVDDVNDALSKKVVFRIGKAVFDFLIPNKHQRWNKEQDNYLLWNAASNKHVTKTPHRTAGIIVNSTGYNHYDITVLYNPYALVMSKVSIAQMYVDYLHSTAVIIVDDQYMAMNEQDRKFVLLHEIGHIAHGHGGVFDKDGKRQLAPEYQADAYAARGLGVEAAINGLYTMRGCVTKGLLRFINKSAVKEIDLRIAKLQASLNK